MKYLAVIALAILVSGCTEGAATKRDITMKGNTTKCVDGVNYVLFPTGASVKYNTDGTVSTCN